MDNNYSDKKSRAGWTENNKDKKLRALKRKQEKFVRTLFFLSGLKGIYHQVKFCRNL